MVQVLHLQPGQWLIQEKIISICVVAMISTNGCFSHSLRTLCFWMILSRLFFFLPSCLSPIRLLFLSPVSLPSCLPPSLSLLPSFSLPFFPSLPSFLPSSFFLSLFRAVCVWCVCVVCVWLSESKDSAHSPGGILCSLQCPPALREGCMLRKGFLEDTALANPQINGWKQEKSCGNRMTSSPVLPSRCSLFSCV